MKCARCLNPLDQPGDLCLDCTEEMVSIETRFPVDFDIDPDKGMDQLCPCVQTGIPCDQCKSDTGSPAAYRTIK